MNDKSIATLILSLEKAIVKDYGVAITEASTKSFESKITLNSNKAIEAHRELFDLMMKNSWYQLEDAEESKIKKECTKLTTSMDEINE